MPPDGDPGDMGSASQAPARSPFDRTPDLAVVTFFGFEFEFPFEFESGFGKAVTYWTGRASAGDHAATGRGETPGPDGG